MRIGLMCKIDYQGFRIIATGVIPIDREKTMLLGIN